MGERRRSREDAKGKSQVLKPEATGEDGWVAERLLHRCPGEEGPLGIWLLGMEKLAGPPLLGESWEGGRWSALPSALFRVPTSLPRPFRPRPPQQPTTEGGDGETKPSQGLTDGSRPEPQRPRNRPYFQRRRQQPPGPRQPTAQEVKTLDCLLWSQLPLSFLSPLLSTFFL